MQREQEVLLGEANGCVKNGPHLGLHGSAVLGCSAAQPCVSLLVQLSNRQSAHRPQPLTAVLAARGALGVVELVQEPFKLMAFHVIEDVEEVAS